MSFFGGPSYWILLLCDWIQHGLDRRHLPDLGESRLDRQRKRIGWLLFFLIWVPLCLFALVLILRSKWLI